MNVFSIFQGWGSKEQNSGSTPLCSVQDVSYHTVDVEKGLVHGSVDQRTALINSAWSEAPFTSKYTCRYGNFFVSTIMGRTIEGKVCQCAFRVLDQNRNGPGMGPWVDEPQVYSSDEMAEYRKFLVHCQFEGNLWEPKVEERV